jgi:hypothetical protein
MENINNFSNNNHIENKIIFQKNDSSRGECRNINEEHILSLRKKRNNRNINNINNIILAQKQLSYNLDINMIINFIKNDELYMKYKNNENEFEKLNLLMQMIISNNSNILKYALLELKKYLQNTKDKNEFESKNLLNIFNEKMFGFLFKLLFKKNNDYINIEEYYQILILLCNIISNLCMLNNFYTDIFYQYFPNLIQKIKSEENNQIKNSIYSLIDKIFLIDNINNNQILQIKQNFFEQIYNEIIYLNEESNNNFNILNLKELFPTLLNITSIIICNRNQILTNSNMNIEKLLNILSFINKYLSDSFIETDILKESLNFLSSILKFYKLNKNIFPKEIELKFRELLNNMEIGNHIILYVYDNTMKDFEFRIEIIELINNMILLNQNEFINNLIKNGISEQISNIQDYLLENENNNIEENNMKLLYNLHIELIYNLISTQSEYAIQDICIENSCISNLFQLINISKYSFNNSDAKILEIFDLIIKSKAEFIHSLLLTEGIYDLYKNILLNNPNNDIIALILNDIGIMIERGKSIKTSSGINIVSNHFIKNGIFDLIENIKGRNDINEQIIYLLDEISNLLK